MCEFLRSEGMFIGYPVLQDTDSLIVQKDGWEDQTLVTTQATGVNWSLRTPWVQYSKWAPKMLEDDLLGTAASTIIALQPPAK
jgi:hypothetical protein